LKMRRVMTGGILVCALALAGTSQAAGPVTKQNGSDAVIKAFTSICAVSGYADYGLCGGDTTKFTDVGGRMNAIQPKAGTYNLEFVFTGLTPGLEYRLWSTRDAVPFGGSFAEVGRAIADGTGSVKYQLQTTSPGGLGFDLNTVQGDITIVTSWWSGQKLVVNPDSTLSTAV
jgi:hypothetical protein